MCPPSLAPRSSYHPAAAREAGGEGGCLPGRPGNRTQAASAGAQGPPARAAPTFLPPPSSPSDLPSRAGSDSQVTGRAQPGVGRSPPTRGRVLVLLWDLHQAGGCIPPPTASTCPPLKWEQGPCPTPHCPPGESDCFWGQQTWGTWPGGLQASTAPGPRRLRSARGSPATATADARRCPLLYPRGQ